MCIYIYIYTHVYVCIYIYIYIYVYCTSYDATTKQHKRKRKQCKQSKRSERVIERTDHAYWSECEMYMDGNNDRRSRNGKVCEQTICIYIYREREMFMYVYVYIYIYIYIWHSLFGPAHSAGPGRLRRKVALSARIRK